MISFSVIIPTHNRKSYLLECLETVFSQSHEPLEVIVVDDGSTDGTIEALQRFEDRIQVIKQENAGPGAARNRGAGVARGDYLAFLDSDDLWFPWTLASFAELIEQNDRPSFLAGHPVDFENIDELQGIGCQDVNGEAFADYLESHSWGYFCGAGTMVLSRSAFELVSGFENDALNAEDHDLALQLGTAIGFVAILQPVTLGRRLHGGNETANINKTLRGLMRLVIKERAGSYPGGGERRAHRVEIISRHIRPAVIGAFKLRDYRCAWSLYLKTFIWHVRLRRFRYLIAVPALAIMDRFSFIRSF